MSQPPDAPDPYLPPHDGRDGPAGPTGPEQPHQQPPPSSPYVETPTYGAQGYARPWAGGAGSAPGRPQAEVRRDRPVSVVRLVQTMWAGAVLALLTGLVGLLSVDSAVTDVAPELERDLADSGLDPASFVEVAGTVAVVTLVVSTVVTVGLWALFAWLFGRGQARVVGTVLGAVNGVGTLVGLFFAADLLDLLLQLLVLVAVVVALVLLWRPSTSAWFAEVKAADATRG